MRRILFILLFATLFFNAWSQLNTNHVIHTGRSRLYFGNYTGAIESFNMVIKMKPFLPEPYFYRGVAKMNLEDYRGALKDIDKSLEIKPYYPEALMYRGIIHYNLKEYNKAMLDYSEAMKLDGENADIYNNRGICKAGMKDLEGAVEDYSKSIELKPKNYNAYLNRSIAYQMLEEWDKAIDDTNQLIRIRPNSPMGYMSRGLIKIEKKDFAGALRDFDMALYLDPKNAFAYHNRGLVKQQLESYESAIMDYNQALSIDKNMASAYFNRAVAKEMSGKNDYQKDYDLAATLDPRYENKPWLTQEERERAQQQQFQNWLQEDSTQNIVKTDSTRAEDKKLAIDLDELQRRKMRAMLTVEDNRDIPGDDNDVSNGRIQDRNIEIDLLPIFEVGIINKGNANNENVGYFNMLIENLNAKNNYQPYLTLSNNIVNSSQTDHLFTNQILIYNEKIKQNKNYSNNYLYRGIFYTLNDEYEKAIVDFDHAIKLDERNVLAYFLRSVARVKIINAIQMVQLPSHLNTAEPFQSEKSETRIEALDDIFTDLSVVLYMNPEFYFAYFNRGNVYCRNQQYLAAMDEYTKAIDKDPEFAEAYYNRGLVRILLDDVDGGAKDLSKAGELGIKESYNVIKRYCNQ